MKKSDLKTGMIVTTQNGSEWVVMLDCWLWPDKGYDLLVMGGGLEAYIQISYYGEDLIFTNPLDRDLDIVKIEIQFGSDNTLAKKTIYKKQN